MALVQKSINPDQDVQQTSLIPRETPDEDQSCPDFDVPIGSSLADSDDPSESYGFALRVTIAELPHSLHSPPPYPPHTTQTHPLARHAGG